MTGTAKVALAVAVGLAAGTGGGYLLAANTVEPGVVTETVTETKTVEVVPQTCLDAVHAATTVHGLLLDKWATAVGVGNAADVDELLGDLESLGETSSLDAASEHWYDTREGCLAAAE